MNNEENKNAPEPEALPDMTIPAMKVDFDWLLSKVGDTKRYIEAKKDSDMDAFSKDLLETYHAALVSTAKILLMRINVASMNERADAVEAEKEQPASEADPPADIMPMVEKLNRVAARLFESAKAGTNLSINGGVVHLKMKDAFPKFTKTVMEKESVGANATNIDDGSDYEIIISYANHKVVVEYRSANETGEITKVTVY